MNILGPSVNVYHFVCMDAKGRAKKDYTPWPGKLVDSHERGRPSITWRGPNPEDPEDISGTFYFQASDGGNRYVIEFSAYDAEKLATHFVETLADYKKRDAQNTIYRLEKALEEANARIKEKDALLAEFTVRATKKEETTND